MYNHAASKKQTKEQLPDPPYAHKETFVHKFVSICKGVQPVLFIFNIFLILKKNLQQNL